MVFRASCPGYGDSTEEIAGKAYGIDRALLIAYDDGAEQAIIRESPIRLTGVGAGKSIFSSKR